MPALSRAMASAGDTDKRRDAIEDNQLRPAFVGEVLTALDAGDHEAVVALVGPLHPADIADLFETVDAARRPALGRALGDRLDADVIAEMTDWVRDEVIDALGLAQVSRVVAELDTDDAVALVEDLDQDDREAVLDSLTAEDRAAIEEALSYPEESAGRLMRRDLVAVPEHWTVARVVAFVREDASLTPDFWEIFVVDEGHRPIGTTRLSWLMRAPEGVAMGDVMQREQTLIDAGMDQEEVALTFQKYALISAAVVDAGGRLVGVITVDDIVHVIAAEASEDMMRLVGAGDEGDINEPVIDTVKVRVRWLIVNLGTAMLASLVISGFSETISSLVLLAALMPIVASIGGNAGTQTLAVAVRALATNQLTEANARRAIFREMRIAVCNGLILGTLVGGGAALIFGNPLLGAVMAAALVINTLVAGAAGVLIPVTLDRAGIDPAISSSVFVTMATDVMGFFTFLGLATATGLAG